MQIRGSMLDDYFQNKKEEKKIEKIHENKFRCINQIMFQIRYHRVYIKGVRNKRLSIGCIQNISMYCFYLEVKTVESLQKFQ